MILIVGLTSRRQVWYGKRNGEGACSIGIYLAMGTLAKKKQSANGMINDNDK